MTEQTAVTVRQEQPELSVVDVRRRVNMIQQLISEVMKKDIHYGVIPGTDKPTLFKPGAELIGTMFRLAPSFTRQHEWDAKHLTIYSECALTDFYGRIVASAGGSCSTKETKYAYRQAVRKCPECGAATIFKSKQTPGFYCWAKKGGCGAQFKPDDPKITTQSGDREENPNLPDTYNTVLKMADKRALVAATLMGTAASNTFTQDVEDFASGHPPPPPTEWDEPPPDQAQPLREAMGKRMDAVDQAAGLREAMNKPPSSTMDYRESPMWKLYHGDMLEAARKGTVALKALWMRKKKDWQAGCTPEFWAMVEADKEDMKELAKQVDDKAAPAFPSGEADVPA